MERYIKDNIIKDLNKKMVFIGGPRQVGKTTFAQGLLKTREGTYLNWDDNADRERLMAGKLRFKPGLVVLDEIHKYKRWRQLVKGVYDKRKEELNILVTGSARLDYYRYGGDSLQGRYHYYRMHPLSFKELGGKNAGDLESLLMYGAFPEPFFAASEAETRRWSRAYRTRLVREDLRDLERINDISMMERMIIRLPELVGQPLSINALREDLQVSHQTVVRWLQILERLYHIFRIYPFGGPNIRAVKKEAKHYHFDWTQIGDSGARFENLVACHLLKWCHFLQDTEGWQMELRYFRDTDKREVDFVVIKENRPIYFIETKISEKTASSHLKYLKKRFAEVPSVQLSLAGTDDVLTRDDIRLCPANIFLAEFI